MNFGALAVVVAAGMFGPLLASVHRLAPPVVVGQILAGIVIGRSGLDWVDPNQPVLVGLASIGFALLMFIVGTHLPLRDRRIGRAWVSGIAITATVVLLAAPTGLLLAHITNLHRPAVLAVLIASSSGAVALPVIAAIGRSDRTLALATTWTVTADVTTVLAVPLVMATGTIGRIALGGVLIAGLSTSVYVLARWLRDTSPVIEARRRSGELGWGLDLRVSLLLLFGLAWLATRFDTSVLFAGFATGAVVSLLGEPRRVAQQLVGLGEGFLVPLFFVHLGMQLDVVAMFRSRSDLLLAALLCTAAILVHLVAAGVWGLPIAAGLITSAQLGIPAAVVSLGLYSRALRPGQGAAIMTAVPVTLLGCAVGSLLLGGRPQITDASAPRPTPGL